MPITFDQIEIVDNGARFYTADLHLHSFGASADVSDNTMTVEAIIDAAARTEISILAITDHNTYANLQRALDYADKYIGQLLLLPGIEITTANGHLLVYFAPDAVAAVRDLLAIIQITGNPGARDTHTTMSMANVITQSERLGGICIAAHIDRPKSAFGAIDKGYPNWKRDIILSSGLYALEVDDSVHLVWYSSSDERTSEGAERKKLVTAGSQAPATAARGPLAAVQNSDAHTMVQSGYALDSRDPNI